MKIISLTKGKTTIVDNENFDFLTRWKWYYTHGYAARGGNPKIYMHRLINKTPEELQTDHINRNTLDNRKCNLRSVTRSQNKMNTGLWKHNTSGHKGVYWRVGLKKWGSQIKVNYRVIYLGTFKNITDAILVREKAEQKYYEI